MFFNFTQFGDRVAVRDDMGNALSYKELAKFSHTLNGIAKRALCLNLCESSIGSLLGYACMIEVGIVPLMFASDMESSLIDKILLDYKPEFIWLPSKLKDRYVDMGYKEVLNRFSYTLLESSSNSHLGDNQLHEDLALLLSTSGSTGSSKMVRQSYKNIKSNTESIIEYLHIDKDQRAILVLPMHYTFGLSIINTHLYVGAMILLSDKSLMQKQLWEFISTQKATSLSGVPYTYAMLKKLKFFTMCLPHLQTLTQAGGKLSLELSKEFATFARENNKKFIVMYGQTEATARMSYLPSDKAIEKCGSIGVAITNGSFLLLDSQGAIIQEGNTEGELLYKGDNVALGYAHNRKSLKKGDELMGVLHTGDIAKRDNDGYYYIVGRKSRFIKMFGKRMSLDEIDCMIESEFSDMEAKSSGRDDRLYIFITQKREHEVKKFICDTLKLAPIALKVQYIKELPRNESGKILYSVLEDYYDWL